MIDLATGEVVGLHFAGRYKVTNYAVPSYELARDPYVREAGPRFAGEVSAGAVEWMDRWREADPQSVAVDAAPTIPGAVVSANGATIAAAPVVQGNEAVFTLPLRISVSIGSPGLGAPDHRHPVAVAHAEAPRTRPDPDYSSREGYDPHFLEGHYLRLPWLTSEQYQDTARNSEATSQRHVLPYHHFSVVMSKKRRLAYYTAVNIDGKRLWHINRDDYRDWWVLDPRIPSSAQLENNYYKDSGGVQNPLDRGHLVRRLDPCWGSTKQEVIAAHHDTFHWTNCSPQHAGFNQSSKVWLGIEEYILKKAAKKDVRVSVFSGPVLDDDDRTYPTPTGLDLELPTRYWKVVAVQSSGKLVATGYLLSQEGLVDTLVEVPIFGEFKGFQVTVAEIEELTSLHFWGLADADPLADATETVAGARPRHELFSLVDIVLEGDRSTVYPTPPRKPTPKKKGASKKARSGTKQ